MKKQRVFITRAGVSSPIGNGVEEFYRSIGEAVCGIKKISRFDTSRLVTRIGGECALDEIIEMIGCGEISSKYFRENIILRENPKLAFAINAISSITKDGYIKAAHLKETVLFTSAGLEEIDIPKLENAGSDNGDTLSSVHLCAEIPPAFLGELICERFGLEMAPVTLVSACSAGAQAVGEAFKRLSSGAINAAIAGGTDSMLFAFGINAFNSIGAISENNDEPENAIRPFDRSRSGTVLGEGAAYFLLENETRLKESGHSPIAEIAGYGSSLDAYNPVQPDPSGKGAALAMNRSLSNASIESEKIDYINAHGTGTHHNDIAETLAVKTAFGEHSKKIIMSSTKPYFGHLLSAAGAIELLTVLFAFERGVVPPTLNLSERDPACDLDYAAKIPVKKTIDFAMTNSFGLNGQNAVIILKKA